MNYKELSKVIDSVQNQTEVEFLKKKLWEQGKVEYPSDWTDEMKRDFEIGIEDFDLDDDPDTILRSDGKFVWLEDRDEEIEDSVKKVKGSEDADRAFLEGKGFDVFRVDEYGNFYVKNFYDVVPAKFNSEDEYRFHGTQTEEFQEWWNSNIGDDWGCQPADSLEGNTWWLEKY